MNPKIVTSDEGTRWNFMGDAVRIILRCEDTGGSFTLVQQRSAPGAGVPPHVHSREDETFQIIEGKVEFQIGDRTVIAEAGTAVYAPKDLPHGFRVIGDEPALMQILMVPGGLEKMFEEIVHLPPPLDPASVEGICRRHGVEFVGHAPGAR